MKRLRQHLRPAQRRGTLIPLLAFAILATCAAGALVLDRLWIDAAQVQLQAAADASALAAAGHLIDDDRLCESSASEQRLHDARLAADQIARANIVSGRPVELDLHPNGDIRFGKLTEKHTTGERLFLETNLDPTHVIVTAQCLRQRSNALLLFFRGVTGQHFADAQAQAVAKIDNRIIGIRPLSGSSVPLLPLAILDSDPAGERQNTWRQQIDDRQGQDRYGYDETTGTLLNEPDGIPEIILNLAAEQETADTTNVRMLDLGTNLVESSVQAQIAGGVTRQDLNFWGGELVFAGSSLPVNNSAPLVTSCLSDLLAQVGRTRICLLYQQSAQSGSFGSDPVEITRPVAIRILTLEHADNGPVRLVVQPSVIATRAAVLCDPGQSAAPNPYIYNLSLTH